MLSYGFGTSITGFENAYRQADPDTPHLTVGHTPSSFGGSSSRGAFAFAFGSHDDSLRAEHHDPSFLYMSHQTAPTHFFGIPLLDQPLVVRVLAATSAILAFIVGHSLFVGLYVSFRRNLPHSRVCQQLEAFLDIHDERRLPTLDPTSTWWSLSRGAFAFGASTFATHRVLTCATHEYWDSERETTVFISFFYRRPRPRARPRPRPRPRRGGLGGLGSDVRVDVRRTEGHPPPSS